MAISSLLLRAVDWLNRPLFGTKVIPPDAAVPQADFPDDEFPVFCPGCDYLLRGLAHSRCPECGREFDRGRLLVDQYVRERAHRLWEHGLLGRWSARMAAAVLGLLALWVIGTNVAWRLASFPLPGIKTTARQVDRWVAMLQVAHQLFWWVQVFMLAALVACVLVVIRAARRNTRKRQRVMDAIS